MTRPRSASRPKRAVTLKPVCDDHGAGEVAEAKPIKVIKKENRAAANKAKFKAD